MIQTSPIDLTELHKGVHVPEYGVRVPWLITEDELFELIPNAAFTISSGGWPMLTFTLLGVTALFGFNFVTHPDGKLIEIQYRNEDEATLLITLRESGEALRSHLGFPSMTPTPLYLVWDDGQVHISSMFGMGYTVLAGPENQTLAHTISVFAMFGLPSEQTYCDLSSRRHTKRPNRPCLRCRCTERLDWHGRIRWQQRGRRRKTQRRRNKSA